MASSTREKILAVSLRLFNEQGYRNVTMRAIADALSISVGNLTYHFAKKQDIVAALMDDVFAQMTATADMPAASLAQIDSLFSMMLDTLERCAFFFLDNELKQENGPLHLAHHTHLRARLIDGLTALAEHGFFIESFTPEVCRTLIQILLMSHMTWLKQTVRGQKRHEQNRISARALAGAWPVSDRKRAGRMPGANSAVKENRIYFRPMHDFQNCILPHISKNAVYVRHLRNRRQRFLFVFFRESYLPCAFAYARCAMSR